MLRKLDGFKAHVVIAKKDLEIFEHKHNSNTADFYFDDLRELLKGRLNGNFQHQIYLSERQGDIMQRFEKAVKDSFANVENCQYELELVNGKEVPELSIVDNLIWAVQRKLVKGEMRYFQSLFEKFGDVVMLYEEE